MSFGAPINFNVADVNWVFDGDTSSQSYEQLLVQRNQVDNYQKFDSVFKCIKEKIFAMHDNPSHILLTDTQIENYKVKYNIEMTTNSIETLKNNISELYSEKIKIDNKINANFNKYNEFIESINNVTEKMEAIITTYSPEDEEFKKKLIDRIEWYYKEFDLEYLLSEQKRINSEYNYLKETIVNLSGITNPIVCQICYVNQVAFFVDPCGHTLCESCKIKCQTLKNCHYCRSVVKSFNKLFL